jgi:2-(1,2-epoxy-1,2-dihydrophenyl)acetyl-CoA isomerase
MEQDGGVLSLTLDRPKVNAFDRTMVSALRSLLVKNGCDENVRCIVLTGAGDYFSTGHDVSDILQAGRDVPYRYHLEQTYNRLVLEMRKLEKPILGAINGPAAGAGLGLALATDIRLASESARFLYGFSAIGLSADSGVSLTLPEYVGYARAMEMAATNQPLTADQALAAGLVNRVLPSAELMPAVQELAQSIASGPTRAIGLSKRAFNRMILPRLERALAYEAILQQIAGASEDHQEGLAAFLEKRPPEFRGR